MGNMEEAAPPSELVVPVEPDDGRDNNCVRLVLGDSRGDHTPPGGNK